MSLLEDDRTRAPTCDFLFTVFETEMALKELGPRMTEFILDTDYNGPINTLSDNIADFVRFIAFDRAMKLLITKLETAGHQRPEIFDLLSGLFTRSLPAMDTLLEQVGLSRSDLDAIMLSVGTGREWRNYGKC